MSPLAPTAPPRTRSTNFSGPEDAGGGDASDGVAGGGDSTATAALGVMTDAAGRYGAAAAAAAGAASEALLSLLALLVQK